VPLDALDPTWINAPAGVGPSYDSEELRRDLGFLLAGGATPDVSRTGVLDPRALLVTLSGSNVQINPGGCAIGTGKGAYLTGAKTTATIDALTPADGTNPRRDRVVLEILDPDNGGGAGRKGQFRVITGTPSATAASGGGYPAAPTSPFLDLYDIDVPKSGNGNPSLTDKRPFTAAAGSPIPVRTAAELAALPKWNGARAHRLDKGWVEYCDGTIWSPVPPAPHIEFTYNTPANAIPNGAVWGPGLLTLDNTATSTDTSLATSPGADLVVFAKKGIYDVWFGGAFGHGLTGVSWFQIKKGDDTEVFASSPANEFWGCVSIQGLVIAADNTQIRLRLKASIAGDVNSKTNGAGKVRITRRG
jgi:hypothetical protein